MYMSFHSKLIVKKLKIDLESMNKVKDKSLKSCYCVWKIFLKFVEIKIKIEIEIEIDVRNLKIVPSR